MGDEFMIKLKRVLSAGVTLMAATMMVACGSSSSSSSSSSSTKSTDTNSAKVTFKTDSKKGDSKGGSLKVAEISDTPFSGDWLPEIGTSGIDSDIIAWARESLFKTDKNFNFVDGGAANIKFDDKAKTATVNINPKLKWSDGKKVVAKDLEYSYEIIANQGTLSERYTGKFENIEGMKEYHEGKAKTISGITYPNGEDGDSIVIHFKELKSGMTVSGNGWFSENAEPYHYLKDVAFKDLKASKQNKTAPLFFGPYQVSHIVSGQSVSFKPNKYYYLGEPRLNNVTVSMVNPATQAQQIKAKKFDIIAVSQSIWKNVKNAEGYDFLGVKPMQYSYLGFRVGSLDRKKNENVQNPNAKMGNEKLRQAMAYAMNVDQVVNKFGNGIGYRDTTLIPTAFGEFHDSKAKGFPYDPAKAKKLLDEAGYKMGKDGYRTDPDGKKLTITFAAMSKDSDQKSIINNYLQKWKEVGLRVQLLNGKLTEFNSFYDTMKKADQGDVDVFMAAWALSSEPSDCADLYSANNPMNYSRFNSKKNNDLIKDIQSQESATDHDHFVESMIKWQDNMNKEAYIVPLNRFYLVTAVNKKVENFSAKLAFDTMGERYKVGINK